MRSVARPCAEHLGRSWQEPRSRVGEPPAVSRSSSSKSIGASLRLHMPFDVIGQHAQEHMSTDALWQLVVDGTDVKIDGLVAAKRTLDDR